MARVGGAHGFRPFVRNRGEIVRPELLPVTAGRNGRPGYGVETDLSEVRIALFPDGVERGDCAVFAFEPALKFAERMRIVRFEVSFVPDVPRKQGGMILELRRGFRKK